MKHEGSWHCKPWCTKKHKYPKQQTTEHRTNKDQCSFDNYYYKSYQDLKGLISRLVKEGFGCELKDNKLTVRAVREGKVKTKKFRLDKDFYKLSAGEQIKKINKSLKTIL